MSGNHHVSAAEIAGATGLNAGISLLAVSPRRVSDLVCSLPWVKSAEVRRIYPHRLSISVQERSPVAAVAVPSSQVLTVGEGGIIVEAGRSSATLPELVGAPLSAEAPGGEILDRRVIDLIDTLASDTDLRGVRIRKIDVTDPASVVLYADDGLKILLGGLDGFAAGLDGLAALARTIDLAGYESIDLRFKGEATLVRR